MTIVKQQARKIVQGRLDAVSQDDFERASEAATEKVKDLIAGALKDKGPIRILLYHANPKWREVDLSPLENDFPSVQFYYVPASLDASLPSGRYDIILVPLYGFNSQNYRLGHGAGWYDRLLAGQPRAYKIGVGLEAGRIEFTPEAHDIPLDIVVAV